MLKIPLLLCMAGALVFSATSSATTGPGSRVDVYVHITDKGFLVQLLTQSDFKGGQEMYMTDPTEVVRGEVARFNILNVGKKPHNFTVFGHTTKTLQPGGKAGTCPKTNCAVFIVPLLKRGQFPYKVTVNGNKSLRGVFLVN